MAPFIGPSRAQLVEELQKGRPRLPITLGLYAPQATVEKVDGTWRIVALEPDHEAERRAGEEAIARGDDWMPEHTWQFLRPGRVLVEAKSKADFVEAVKRMKWTFGEGLS